MATLTGTITATGQEVQIVLPTVRIPELPEMVSPMEGADKIPVFDASENSTRWKDMAYVRDFLITGGAAAGIPPVLQGDDLEVIAQVSNMSGYDSVTETYNRVLVPVLENKTFTLERVGYGSLLTTQFLILPSGGWELVDDVVRLGDIFFAHVYSATAGAPGGGSSSGGSALVSGIALITDDTTLNSAHYSKVLHLSNTTKNLAVTLFDISAAPANLIIPIETTISNGFMSKIQTQGGQFIYVAGSAVTSLWLGSNEFMWLLRGTDGWYVMKASESIFNVGQPFMDYQIRMNSLRAIGQLVQRSAVPRIVEWLASNPNAVVTESTWQSDPIMRGKFSYGDGSTTIRFPDHQNRVYRALNNIGASDAERPDNTQGTNQEDTVGPHTHPYNPGDQAGQSDNANDRNVMIPGGTSKTTGQNTGSTETRMKNVGLLPLIRT